jgi:hypothetical protein
MRWITRENIKVDRVAGSWLIAQFVDKDAEFLFVRPRALGFERSRKGSRRWAFRTKNA